MFLNKIFHPFTPKAMLFHKTDSKLSEYLEALLVSWASVSTYVFLSINCGDSCLPISSA